MNSKKTAFPISWVTTGQRLMLIGGCEGRLCRLKTALEFNWAEIHVFARECCALPCSDCPKDPRVRVHQRLPEESDVEQADLIIENTECRALAERLHPWAKTHRTPITCMDKKELCDFHYPALLLRETLVLAIQSGGRAPVISALLRKTLDDSIGPGWETAARLFSELRERLPSGQNRNELLKRLANDDSLLLLIEQNNESRMRKWMEDAAKSLVP